MPLLTFSDGRKQYVLRRISTGEVLKRNARYPTATDDGPIDGFDPDLEYLAMDQDVQPDYDARVFDLVTNEAKDGTLWRITFSTLRRDNSTIKVAVTNKEASEVYSHMTPTERDKLMLVALGVLFRQLAAQTLTVKEQAVRNRVMGLAAKLWKNDDNAAALFTAIDAGQTPNIDSGWEPKA